MGDRRSDASELLGVDGFVVLSQTEEDGEVWILVETTAVVGRLPVDDVRRRTQQSVLGHRGHNEDPLYRTRRLMTRGWEHLSDRQRSKLFCALTEGDPPGEVAAAILVN